MRNAKLCLTLNERTNEKLSLSKNFNCLILCIISITYNSIQVRKIVVYCT